MITFSATVQALMSAPNVIVFYMVRLGTINITNFYADILVDGITYLADGRLHSVEPPRLSSTVDKQSFKITINDPAFEMGVLAEANMVGMLIYVRLGFVNPATGEPETSLANTILAYKSKVDSVGYSIRTDTRGEVLFTINCASPMADLDATNPIYLTDDFYSKNYPGDTSFEQVLEGSGPISLKWGKK